MRRIKNREKSTKEDLIISHLKSKSRALENNFIKHFNNNNNNNNKNNNNNNNDTYDDKIRGKISDIRMIRMILSRLGNIITNKDRNKITKELCEIEKRKTFQIRKKRRLMIILPN